MNLLQIIIIAAVVLVVAIVAVVVLLKQEAAKKARIARVVQGRSADLGDSKQQEADLQNKRRAEIAKKLKEEKEEEEEGKRQEYNSLPDKIAQAGLSISVMQYWIFSVISMVLFVLLAKIAALGNIVMVLSAVIGLFGFPRFILGKMAASRQKKFLEDFADALEATVRLLKAGMPVSEAIAMISKEYSGPVGEEMSRIYDKQKIGVPIHEAALEATRRIPLMEMQMFATGLAIQAQTGSSLSEILMNLAGVIRARFRLKRKIKALSSEAIASASIIGALPPLVALGLYFANPEYITLLFTDPFGNVLLAGSVTWMSIGVFVMRAMINFKI